MTLSHTKIEYILKPDGSLGYSWGIYTGCLHGKDVCATSETCWARNLAHRFHRDFTPRFHPELIEAPMNIKKPSAFAVAFSGDMFGEWNWEPNPLFASNSEWIVCLLETVKQAPQHRFFFLTKNPKRYAEFNSWPSNAWVGTSITGAETTLDQHNRLHYLSNVQGAHLWLSYEPILGSLTLAWPRVEWLVLGAQTGKQALRPERWCIKSVEGQARRTGVKIWRKTNLLKLFPDLERIQEKP